MRKVAIIASASGNGKTTLGRSLAERLEVPFIELDGLVHGPGWVETGNAELRRLLEPTLAGDGWVIDGTYQKKLGELIIASADTVIWLDLPMRVWLLRLIRRTYRRYIHRETLWNGNRESLKDTLWGRDSLFGHALQSHFERRRRWPLELSAYPVVRLRTPAEVKGFLAQAEER
jgi:adenylate kinase family enzyme